MLENKDEKFNESFLKQGILKDLAAVAADLFKLGSSRSSALPPDLFTQALRAALRRLWTTGTDDVSGPLVALVSATVQRCQQAADAVLADESDQSLGSQSTNALSVLPKLVTTAISAAAERRGSAAASSASSAAIIKALFDLAHETLSATEAVLKAASPGGLPPASVALADRVISDVRSAGSKASEADGHGKEVARRAAALVELLESRLGGAEPDRLSRQARLILTAGKHEAAAVRDILSAPAVPGDPVDVNGADKETGDTALHRAVGSLDPSDADEEIVKLLIARGASVKAENAKGKSPLHVAAENADKMSGGNTQLVSVVMWDQVHLDVREASAVALIAADPSPLLRRRAAGWPPGSELHEP